MIPFKIKNWLITEDGIQWDGEPKITYHISRDRLAEVGPGDRRNMYDWLIHMPEKTWLTETDVYALNTALIYAFDHFGIDFRSASFVETLKEQQDALAEKEAD